MEEDYKKRVAIEYQELKERVDKLHSFTLSIECGHPLHETPTPLGVLIQQETAMKQYLLALETRAKYEKINLEER